MSRPEYAVCHLFETPTVSQPFWARPDPPRRHRDLRPGRSHGAWRPHPSRPPRKGDPYTGYTADRGDRRSSSNAPWVVATTSPEDPVAALAVIREERDRLVEQDVSPLELESAQRSWGLTKRPLRRRPAVVCALLAQAALAGRPLEHERELSGHDPLRADRRDAGSSSS